MNTLIRLPALMSATALPRSSVYSMIARGLLPTPIKLSERSVAWVTDEIAAINSARIRGADDEKIRALVKQLEAQRTVAA